MLTLEQCNQVCLANRGAKQCRYFDGGICRKLDKAYKARIDNAVSKIIQDLKAKGTDPNKTHHALGNNCSGFLPLKHIRQGINSKPLP